MQIDEVPIDARLIKVLQEDGIETLYPPQAESIKAGLLDSTNFVVAIPTASGKTLIAILAIVSQLLKNPGSKAVYLAPLRALASEKFDEFRRYAKPVGLKVAISTGDYDRASSYLSSSDIVILTNEKFDSIIRHGASWLNDISIVISDEVHLINDSSRGPVLEVVLSLIRRNLPECQIVALSATIENADEIADWLDATLITSNWRPVKLVEGVWFEGNIKYSNGKKIISGAKSLNSSYAVLATETVLEDGQVIVFANTRKSAEASADLIGKKLSKKLLQSDFDELLNIASSIRTAGEKTEMRQRLAKVIESGSAFHHAGLAAVHRKIVEDGFKSKVIKVVSSTPSLAVGVNLPGRRVIIRSLSRYTFGFGNAPIPVLEYKQMAGRAGRPRYDKFGEAIVIAKNEEEGNRILDRYIRADTEEIDSKLGTEPALRSHILAFVASEYVDTFETALEMIEQTFWGFQNEGSMFLIEGEIEKAIKLLQEAKLITPSEPMRITPFGQRTTELYLDPLSARTIKHGLEKALKKKKNIPNIVYFQLIATTPDIRTYSIREKDMEYIIDTAEEYAEDWIDIDDTHDTEFGQDIFLTTLKIAITIDMWLNESSESDIFARLGISSGDLHHLLSTSEWLLHCAAEFSRIFKWPDHQKTLGTLIKRLKYGVSEDLLKLVEIKGIGRVRSRALYQKGYKTIQAIIDAPETELARVSGFGPQLAKNLKLALTEGGPLVEVVEPIVVDKQQSSLEKFFD